MHSNIIKICKRQNEWKTFHEFIYKTISWSDDELAYCPKCGMATYDESYNVTHAFLNLNGREIMKDDMKTITIDLPEDVLFQLMLLAHERDITLNQLISDILVEHIDNLQSLENDTDNQVTGC